MGAAALLAAAGLGSLALHRDPEPAPDQPLPTALVSLRETWATGQSPGIEELEAAEQALRRGGFSKAQWPEVVAMTASLAESLHTLFGADRAIELMSAFEAAIPQGRRTSEYYMLVKGDILYQASRDAEALVAVHEGLKIVQDRQSRKQPIDPADPSCEEVLLRSLLAAVHQKLGNVLASTREVSRIARLDVKDSTARKARLFATADQLLLSDDHELTLQVLQDSTEFADDPIANLYRAVAEAGLPEHHSEGLARLRACREDPLLEPWHRALAAAKVVQIGLSGDVTPRALTDDLQLAQQAVDAAASQQASQATGARLKLIVAHADAWLRFGDAIAAEPDELLRQLRLAMAPLTATPRKDGITASHAQLWDDEGTWLITTLMRLEWRLAADSEAAWRRVLEHLLSLQATLDLQVPPLLDPERARAYFAGERRGLAVIVPGRTCSVLFVLDAHGAALVDSLPGAKQLRGLHTEMLGTLQRCAARTIATAEETRAAIELMRAAGATLFPEVEGVATAAGEAASPTALSRIASWQAMTLCSLGQLDGMPFDAMIAPDQPDRALGERFAIAHAVSLAHDPARDPGLPDAGASSAGLLATLFSDQAAPEQVDYVFSDAQLQRLVGALPAGTRVWSNAAATTAAWTEACRRPPQLLVVIAHGCRIPTGQSRFNTVKLTPRRAAEATALIGDLLPKQAARFIVLAACDHADTPHLRGDLALANSLAGELLLRGACAVVTPLGKLMLGPHIEFLVDFNRSLRETSFAESLRAARAPVTSDFAERVRRLLLVAYGCGHARVFAPR